MTSGRASLYIVVQWYWGDTVRHFGGLLFFAAPVMVFVLWLLQTPCYCFWNRRANRLAKEAEATAEVLVVPADTWPPPPRQSSLR